MHSGTSLLYVWFPYLGPKFLVRDSGTSNLDGELGSCAICLSEYIWNCRCHSDDLQKHCRSVFNVVYSWYLVVNLALMFLNVSGRHRVIMNWWQISCCHTVCPGCDTVYSVDYIVPVFLSVCLFVVCCYSRLKLREFFLKFETVKALTVFAEAISM